MFNYSNRNIANGKMTILIVEDDSFSTMLLKEFLANDCVSLFHVSDGKAAVNFCKEKNVDIVLMDIRLPKMNGIEAMKHIKSNSPNQKIIAQTACVIGDEADSIKNAGFDACITKPYKKHELLRAVVRIGIKSKKL